MREVWLGRVAPAMSKKVRERIYRDSFLKAVSWEPANIVESESPDFLLSIGTRLVGVELVQVFADQELKRSKMRERESRRLSWLGELAEDYYNCGGTPARVQLQFEPSFFAGITGKIPAELRGRILARLRARIARMEEGATPTSRIRGKHQSLLATFWIRKLPPSFGRYTRWRLANDAVAWARRLRSEHVVSLIAKKASLLPEHHRRAADIVLVIVADKFLASGMIMWSDERVASLGFEAVYLLHYPEAEVVQVA